MKFARVQEVFKTVEDALENTDTEDGQWGRRRKELEKEVRKRVPEFQVIVGFSQQQQSSVFPPTLVADQSTKQPSQRQVNLTKSALLRESAQRLLLLYHRYLPEVVVESRFDVGKTLSSLRELAAGEGMEDVPGTTQKLQLVQPLHVLRTLKESDQFIWTNKTRTSMTLPYWCLTYTL